MEKKGKKNIFCKVEHEPRFVKKNENNEAVLIFFLKIFALFLYFFEKKRGQNFFSKVVYEPRFIKKIENNEMVLIFF